MARLGLVALAIPVLCGLRFPTASVSEPEPVSAPDPASASASVSVPEPEPASVSVPVSAPEPEPVSASVPVSASASVPASASASVPEPASEAAAVPDCVPTPLSTEALARALFVGHQRHFGRPPSADRWSCAWAQCAFEQSRGQAIYANNIGHLTLPRSTGRVCRRRLYERRAKRSDRWEMQDIWFRAFDTPEDGAAAYWQLLDESYHSVLAHCDDAEVRKAAQRLAEIGYFTGPAEPYIDGMARLFVHARGSLIPRLTPTTPLPR